MSQGIGDQTETMSELKRHKGYEPATEPSSACRYFFRDFTKTLHQSLGLILSLAVKLAERGVLHQTALSNVCKIRIKAGSRLCQPISIRDRWMASFGYGEMWMDIQASEGVPEFDKTPQPHYLKVVAGDEEE